MSTKLDKNPKFVGVDLHKQTITVCVLDQSRKVIDRARIACEHEDLISAYFKSLGECEVVVEATASYEWFVKLIEPFANHVILAHPKKLRVIAESTRKSDKLDAHVLATFLALDMVPASYRPTPRQRDHRRLVRQRDSISRRITSVKNRLRRLMMNYNADRRDLFSRVGLTWLQSFAFSPADEFTARQLVAEFQFFHQQLLAANRQLRSFLSAAPTRERQLRELLLTIPGVGFVTAEVVLAEIAEIDRFRSQKQVVAYAGLAPGQRESGGKSRELHIEKTGSKHLRWILVEAAWRLVRLSPRWNRIYLQLKQRVRSKKAIVAVARRLLCLMTAIMKSGEPYSAKHAPDVRPLPGSGSANGSRPVRSAIAPAGTG